MAKETQQLGKYRILEELGKGGFATVYRALDTTLEREVALKVLDPLLMRDETWVERFHREAKAVARLNHPSIVTIYEIGEAGDRLFIAMELIEGPELGALIAKRDRLTWEETLDVLAQVTNALSYAHDKEIIHRDLKPANILIDEQRGAVLTDFGFARLVSESSMSVSVSGGIVGTPQYIAPEIWDGESASLQTDVYALACIVYEMMTGQALFEGATPAVVMRKHLIDGPSFPEQWPEGVPPGMKSVLEKALAQDPDERYASAGAFVADLQNMTGQTPDPLAEPYKGLKAALSGGRWDFALRRADEIMAQDPEYRDVQALRERAAEGKAAAERAQRAAQWREQALEAERRGDVEAARVATQRWLEMVPESSEARALLEQLHGSHAKERSSEPDLRPEPISRLKKTPRFVCVLGSVGVGMVLLVLTLGGVFLLNRESLSSARDIPTLVPTNTLPPTHTPFFTLVPTRTPLPTMTPTPLRVPAYTPSPYSSKPTLEPTVTDAPTASSDSNVTHVTLKIVTADGTSINPKFELFSANGLNRGRTLFSTILDKPDDLQSGQTDIYEFTVPASFCELGGWDLTLPNASVDPWGIDKIYVKLNGEIVTWSGLHGFGTTTRIWMPWDGENANDLYRERCGE